MANKSFAINTPPAYPPDWWGSSTGQTASLYYDFSTEGTSPDDYVIGENLQHDDFSLTFTNASWVNDPVYGPGYQANSQAFLTYRWDNLYVRENVKNLFEAVRFIAPPGSGANVTLDSLIADWGTNPQGNITNKNFGAINLGGWDYVFKLSAIITPQPDSVTAVIKWTGGSPPVIFETYAGEICSPIPEPSTLLLLGSGLVGAIGFGRKRLFKKALKKP